MQQEKLTLQQLIDDNVAQIISPEDGEEGTTTPQATQQPVRLKATATPAPNMEELVAPPNETAAEDVSRSAGGTRRRQQ